MSGLRCDGDVAAAAIWRLCPRTAAVYPGEPCQEREATGFPGLAGRAAISVNINSEEYFNYWLGALLYYDNIKREGIVFVG